MSVSGTFSPVVASIRAARQFVLDAIGGLSRDQHDAIAVMVSELAMNAVQYARTAFTVRAELSGSVLRVEVTDTAPAQPHAQPVPPPTSPHGRGLFLVGELADRWGIMRLPDEDGKTVWFETTIAAAPSHSASAAD